jgi:hypothetical protein
MPILYYHVGNIILKNNFNVFFLVEPEYDLLAELLCLSTILKDLAGKNSAEANRIKNQGRK